MTKFFSLLMLVNGGGTYFGTDYWGQLLQFTTWRGVFIVLGAISVFMLISATFVLRETLPPEERETGGLSGTLATYGKLLRVVYLWDMHCHKD